MPAAPDCACLVINADSGYVRENMSWVIGRLIRDYDFWIERATTERLKWALSEKWKDSIAKAKNLQQKPEHIRPPQKAGLCVAVYQPSSSRTAGCPIKDHIYYSGFAVASLQLALSAVPLFLDRDWGVMLITVAGIMLAFLSGSLPQWRKEKWACRRNTKKTTMLTRGNGSQHVLLILGNSKGLDLEDLASAQPSLDATMDKKTRASLVALAILWMVLLITATGLKRNSWVLLAVGTIGIFQNVFVAGWRRRPEAFGIHLDFVEVIAETKVMNTLFKLEEKYERAGKSLLPIFFPGQLRDSEKETWKEIEEGWRLKKTSTLSSRASQVSS